MNQPIAFLAPDGSTPLQVPVSLDNPLPVYAVGGGGGGVTSVNGQTGVVTLDAADVGAAASGLATASGLTMNTAKLLGRTTANSGAIEEIAISANLTLSAGTLGVAAAQTTISSLTAPTNTELTLATLDNNKNINLNPHGSGVVSAKFQFHLHRAAGDDYGLNLTADNGSGSVYIDSFGDSAGPSMNFRLRTSGSAVNALSFSGAGVATFPSLAGVGTRPVVVDASGVMSAP